MKGTAAATNGNGPVGPGVESDPVTVPVKRRNASKSLSAKTEADELTAGGSEISSNNFAFAKVIDAGSMTDEVTALHVVAGEGVPMNAPEVITIAEATIAASHAVAKAVTPVA